MTNNLYDGLAQSEITSSHADATPFFNLRVTTVSSLS